MGPHVVDVVIGLGDESEAIVALLDQNISIGTEGELEDPTEDVGQAPELLGGETQKGLSLGERVPRTHIVLDGDVALPGHRVDLHVDSVLALLETNFKGLGGSVGSGRESNKA